MDAENKGKIILFQELRVNKTINKTGCKNLKQNHKYPFNYFIYLGIPHLF